MKLALAVTVLFLALAGPAAASSPKDYLLLARNADGGFGMTSREASTQFATGWAALGLAAAGRSPRAGRPSAIDYIRRNAGQLRAIGELERTVLVLRASRLNPRRFAGRNLIEEIMRHRRRNGSFANFVSYTSFGVLALRASGVGRRSGTVRSALRWLEREQNRDGGFSLTGRGRASVADDTGYATQALVAAGGRSRRSVRRAAAWLVRRQRADGGWSLGSAGSNAQSTAYAIQALVAAGRGRSAVRRGIRYLRSLTESNGLVRYSRTSKATPVWVTAQALMAMRRKPFPLAPVG